MIALASSGAAALPRWLRATGALVGPLQLATLAGLFTAGGFFAAGGGMALLAFWVLVAWTVGVAVTMLRRPAA